MHSLKWIPLSAEANIWQSSVFLAFEVYSRTLLAWWKSCGKRHGHQYSVCVGKCCVPCCAADWRQIKWMASLPSLSANKSIGFIKNCWKPKIAFGKPRAGYEAVALQGRQHWSQLHQNRIAGQMDVAPWGIDLAGKLQSEKQANCSLANMSTRRQASNLKREQANSSHCQHLRETLASYGTLFFNSKKGASQQQSWPTWALDFGYKARREQANRSHGQHGR